MVGVVVRGIRTLFKTASCVALLEIVSMNLASVQQQRALRFNWATRDLMDAEDKKVYQEIARVFGLLTQQPCQKVIDAVRLSGDAVEILFALRHSGFKKFGPAIKTVALCSGFKHRRSLAHNCWRSSNQRCSNIDSS